jgi:hypothetical protein
MVSIHCKGLARAAGGGECVAPTLSNDFAPTVLPLAVDERGQAACANPQALASRAHRQEHGLLFPGAAAEAGLLDVDRPPFLFAGMDRRLIKGDRLPCFHRQRAGRAHGQTEAGPVAQFLADHAGLAVHQFDGSLRTGSHTQATTIAQFLVNADDGPYHAHEHASKGWVPAASIAATNGSVYDFCQVQGQARPAEFATIPGLWYSETSEKAL